MYKVTNVTLAGFMDKLLNVGNLTSFGYPFFRNLSMLYVLTM